MRNVSHEYTIARWGKYYSSIGVKGNESIFKKEFKKFTFTHTWRNSIRIIQKYSGIGDNKDVLDAGCGWGRMLLGLVDQYSGMNVTALDFQKDAVEKGRELIGEDTNGNKITWTTGDIQAIDVADNSFDVVYSVRVFQHLNSPEKGAAELVRVLRPGGRFVVFIQNKLCPLNMTYYSRLHTPSQVKKWFDTLPIINVRTTSMDFYPGLLAFNDDLAMRFERMLENIPLLNLFGGKVLISGTKCL